ncbi:ABC transporter [Pseudoclavibacter endophyticus]|uniref:ABC transporter ATP-binding protein n=1 Tax=Pseudoclavibacter endophyticus TaxID=1778590 RepID=A0A6H9WM13_9MICO|nr:ABC transporter ATP-binding protein [Pseudoclavibacter endophyticus]KAB1646770.1 ABC transporter ATP-binding protein [Pseudoclavibacter endophyticus]GGA75698.1 ABC transporter [Pseudoclavibacter endophyticus]
MTTAPTVPDAQLAGASQDRSASGGVVELHSVGKSFGEAGRERVVLRDVDARIEPGEIVAVIGASGSGKSTLLRVLGGLSDPTTGRVTIDGTPVQPYDPRSAVAFQEARLLPWRSLATNIALGLPRRARGVEGRERVARLLELVGLSEFAEHRPREISGGMAQRVSLARALARRPDVLLLDEPFGALDALTRLRMHDLLLDIHTANPCTVVFVTHDVDEALILADRIFVVGTEAAASTADGAGRSADDRDIAGAREGATLLRIDELAEPRPRSRSSKEFLRLRHELLAALGVHLHAEAGEPAGGSTEDATTPAR